MNEAEKQRNIADRLNEIESDYDAKVVEENVKDLEGIKKLVSSNPVSAFVDINPIRGRIITDSLRNDIKIIYNHKKKMLEYCVRNVEIWASMTSEAHINFRETLAKYIDVQAQENI